MMISCSTIMAIVQKNRVETSTKVQEVLTKYGCNIRVRLGLHDSAIDSCSNSGLILLQICTEDKQIIKDMEKELQVISDVIVKHMEI